MVDCREHLDAISRGGTDGPVKVCLDIDAGWRALGGLMQLGAKRSPLHDPAHVAGSCTRGRRAARASSSTG